MTGIVRTPISASSSDIETRLPLPENTLKPSKGPFYKDTSTLIALLALLFSFGTTVVSYYRTTEQDHRAMKGELREIFERLAAMPKENLEAYVKYKDNAAFYNAASSSLVQENNMLSLQAGNIISKLPPDQVAAIDMYSLAVAQQNSRYFDNAIKSYMKAVDLADGVDVELGALRGLAALKMITGHTSEGERDFQKSLEIFTKYPNIDPYNQASLNVFTYAFWSGSEAAIGQFAMAVQLLDRADEIVQRLQPGPSTDMLKAQIVQQRQAIVSPGHPASTPNLMSGNPATSIAVQAK